MNKVGDNQPGAELRVTRAADPAGHPLDAYQEAEAIASERDSLLLPARELVRTPGGVLGKPHELECGIAAAQHFRDLMGRDEKMLVVFESIRAASKSEAPAPPSSRWHDAQSRLTRSPSPCPGRA